MQSIGKQKLIRRGLRLEYATLGWNVVGTAVVMAAAFNTGSVTLVGFGLDSLIEIFASALVVWQLKGIDKPERERLALRLIGSAFFVLAVYVFVRLAVTLITGTHPATSVSGIVWLLTTTVAMLLLAWGKGRTGYELSNPVLVTESRVTYMRRLARFGCAHRSAAQRALWMVVGRPGGRADHRVLRCPGRHRGVARTGITDAARCTSIRRS